MGKTIKILFLAANPQNTSRLRLDEEIHNIKQSLREAEFRDIFYIEQEWAVRVSELQGCLLRHKPTIIHFSGHGSQEDGIILLDHDGNSQPVSARSLSQLFSVLKDNVHCVVLNSCYSEEQAQAIAEHVEYVIGMSKAIDDLAAISFAAAFYRAIGYGKDVQTAFELGCGQIDLEGIAEQSTPKLISNKKVKPNKVVFLHDDNANSKKELSSFRFDQSKVEGEHDNTKDDKGFLRWLRHKNSPNWMLLTALAILIFFMLTYLRHCTPLIQSVITDPFSEGLIKQRVSPIGSISRDTIKIGFTKHNPKGVESLNEFDRKLIRDLDGQLNELQELYSISEKLPPYEDYKNTYRDVKTGITKFAFLSSGLYLYLIYGKTEFQWANNVSCIGFKRIWDPNIGYRDSYYCYLIMPKSSHILSLDSIANRLGRRDGSIKLLLSKNPQSSSSYLIPKIALAEHGVILNDSMLVKDISKDNLVSQVMSSARAPTTFIAAISDEDWNHRLENVDTTQLSKVKIDINIPYDAIVVNMDWWQQDFRRQALFISTFAACGHDVIRKSIRHDSSISPSLKNYREFLSSGIIVQYSPDSGKGLFITPQTQDDLANFWADKKGNSLISVDVIDKNFGQERRSLVIGTVKARFDSLQGKSLSRWSFTAEFGVRQSIMRGMHVIPKH